MRAGKVSIEEILEACFRKSLIMRTRPRPSDSVARCVGKREARGLHAKMKCERAHDRAAVSRGVGQMRSTACMDMNIVLTMKEKVDFLAE